MKKTAIALALGLALVACSKKEETTTTSGSAEKAAAQPAANLPLSFAPAGTAIVMGNFEPAPKAYMDAVAPFIDKFKSAMLQSIDGLLQQDNIKQDPKGQAFFTVLKERLSEPNTMQSIGFSENPLAAFYEVNALPVFRMELADPERFKAFVAEMETKLEEKLPTAEVGGQTYWHVTAPDRGEGPSPRFVVAVVDKHLVMTLTPPQGEALLPQLLGLEKPAQSVVDVGTLAATNKEYGYQGYAPSLLLDTAKLLALAMPDQNNWLSNAIKEDGVVIDETCRTEFQGMAAKVPRLVLGAKEMSGKVSHYNMVLQMEGALAGELQKIPAPVPALGSAGKGIEVGLGLNIEQLASFLQAQSQAVQAAPYQCELLAPLNEFAAEMPQALAGMYGAAGFFSGARLALDEADFQNMKMRGTLLVASPNPQGLLGMAMGMMPELAQLGLSADGSAKQLQSPMLQGLTQDSVWVAMTDKAVGIGIGEPNQQAALESALKASAPSPAPLFYFGTDGESYAQFNEGINYFYKSNLPADARMHLGALDPILEPITKASYEFYRSMSHIKNTYVFTGRGLELNQNIGFK